MPFVNAVTTTPIAIDTVDINAIAESPFILLFSLNLSNIIAATVTIGVDMYNGATFIATAIVRAAKATCDSPSPIFFLCSFLYQLIL